MKAEIQRRASLEDKLYAFLIAHPLEELTMRDLEVAAGNAWRSRLPAVRRRMLREDVGVVRWNGKNSSASRYTFLPYQPVGRDATRPASGQRELPLRYGLTP